MGLIPTLIAFAAGTLIKSADANSNNTNIRDAFNNTVVLTDVARTISVAHTFAADILFTDALYDIGKSGATRPRDGFFSRNVAIGEVLIMAGAATTSVQVGEIALKNNLSIRGANAAANATTPLIKRNASDQVEIDSAGVGTKFGADVIIGATNKHRLDGNSAGDTYIYEASANVIQFINGGTNANTMTANGLGTLKAFFPDPTSDTHIAESSADNLRFTVGGVNVMDMISTQVVIQVDRGVRLNSQTSSAGASAGTLTNAPAAGNPGYWLKVNIGGTNYALPCWPG